ncbi:MAG TPA: isocitrate/isopropylmalate family dehydrogenase [Gemmatimonadota bacterium]|nr:isocitrate/isopropylmalate family dehydrogenase [Gemmatimonadota bacterium]
MKTATLIRGDGIGPEVVGAALRVLDAAGAEIEWEERLAGLSALEEGEEILPESTLESFRRTRVALKGPLTTPVGTGFRSVNVAIRKEFDLYANVRPSRTLVRGGRYEGVDLVVVRENTEGLYSGIEHFVDRRKNYAESITIVSREASERVIEFAFELASRRPRKRLTLVHKANILKYTSGLFLDVGRELAERWPDVEFDDRIIDAMAMQLVLDPTRVDVIVTTNMFGDILSDLCAGLVGGLGMAAASNIGTDAAMFEAVHGSAPDIAGKGVANPAAVILAGALLCEHVGQDGAGATVRRAVEAVLDQGDARTPDLGGKATTEEFTEAVLARIR